MTVPYRTTGSGESPAICFVDGQTANRTYGVSMRSAGMCPNCRFPINQVLAFNPTDSHYYLAPCPVCGKFIIYCDIDGNTVNTFTIVSSQKNTPVDNDVDFPNYWP